MIFRPHGHLPAHWKPVFLQTGVRSSPGSREADGSLRRGGKEDGDLVDAGVGEERRYESVR